MQYKKKTLAELDRVNIEEYNAIQKIPVTVVLDNVRSAHNVGSVFRTCDAFLIEKIILCGITPIPPHQEIHKTALGATESVKWEYIANTTDAIQKLKEKGYTIISAEQTHSSIQPEQAFSQPYERTAIIFGHEVYGVADEVITMSDICVEIPQFGTKHSLNISVCVGILIYECFKIANKNSIKM